MNQDRMSSTRSERPPRPRFALYFVATTLFMVATLCFMTVHYSFRELRNSAQDITATLARQVPAQREAGLSPSDIIHLGLSAFHDLQQIELCLDGRCTAHGVDDQLPMQADLLQALGWPCVTQALPAPASGDHATVCMLVDDVMADVSRDIALLLVTQGIGFALWLGASRRFVARRRIWNDRVQRAATTDAATGLLNRQSFKARLGASAAEGEEAWLVVAGIDDLKSINELHGSSVGDHVILAVAGRLKAFGDQIAALGRTGGDEFAFVVRGASPHTLERALNRLRTVMNPPVEQDGLLLGVTLSAGAVALESHLHAPELMRRATVALRAAKKVGADSQSIFNITFDIELRRNHQMRLDLMNAVDNDLVELVYQPIVDARGQVVLAEALARWRHPQMGAVSPEVFIAAAESSGLIHLLGITLLKRACEGLVTARQRGLPLKRMAVNLSPSQLSHPDLTEIVLAVVRDAGLQPSDIELELTESAAMASRQDATRQLRDLADAGFAISIDDFGTGYSSLSRLQTLPIGKLKIDKSFVQASDEPSGAVLLEAMIELARRLGLACVAEGVETEAQMAWLRQRGCGLFQGYLIGKPMPLDQLVHMKPRTLVALPPPQQPARSTFPLAANDR